MSNIGTKILENKQLLHVTCEVVALLGLTVYFSSKNRKLMSHIEELAQRLEEQEDRLQTLETKFQEVGKSLSTLPFKEIADRMNIYETQLVRLSSEHGSKKKIRVQENVKAELDAIKKSVLKKKSEAVKSHPVSEAPETPETLDTKPKHTQPLPPPKPVEKQNKVAFMEDEGSDSDLDNEIQDELAELEENIEEIEDIEDEEDKLENSLKKQD